MPRARVRIHDAADTDNRKARAQFSAQLGDYPHGFRMQRRAAQASLMRNRGGAQDVKSVEVFVAITPSTARFRRF